MIKIKRSNGTGCIRKLSGNRKKPYQAIISKYSHEASKQVYKSIGTYESREKAEFELYKYLNTSDDYNNIITLENLYNMWSKNKYKTIQKNTVHYYKTSYNYIKEIKDINIHDLKLSKIQNACSKLNPVQQQQFKIILHLLYEYAIANDYAIKNYAKYLVLEKHIGKEKKIFTKEEIDIINKNIEKDEIYVILKILLYTGLRINELSNIKRPDINIEKRYIDIKKSKTSSGVRKVPIHKDILELLLNSLDRTDSIIFNNKKSHTKYAYINKIFKKVFPNHVLHETRHTFITQAKKCKLNIYSLKKIVGHSIKDITLDVYTHEDFTKLVDEIDRFKY